MRPGEADFELTGLVFSLVAQSLLLLGRLQASEETYSWPRYLSLCGVAKSVSSPTDLSTGAMKDVTPVEVCGPGKKIHELTRPMKRRNIMSAQESFYRGKIII